MKTLYPRTCRCTLRRLDTGEKRQGLIEENLCSFPGYNLTPFLHPSVPGQLGAGSPTVADEHIGPCRLCICVTGSEGLAASRQHLAPVDSVVYEAVVLQLLIRQILDVVAINSGLDQAVGVLAESRIHIS